MKAFQKEIDYGNLRKRERDSDGQKQRIMGEQDEEALFFSKSKGLLSLSGEVNLKVKPRF